MVKAKAMFWLSGIIGGGFLLFLIALGIADVIKFGWVIVIGVITITLIIGGNMFYSFRKPRDPEALIISKDQKMVSTEEIEEIIRNKLMKDFGEYEDEIYWDGETSHAGKTATPIYFKMVRGRFDRKIYGIVYNMFNPTLGGIVEYDDTKESLKEIRAHMYLRGNKAALLPSPDTRVKTRTTHDPYSGRTVEEIEPVEPAQKEEKNAEGGLS